MTIGIYLLTHSTVTAPMERPLARHCNSQYRVLRRYKRSWLLHRCVCRSSFMCNEHHASGCKEADLICDVHAQPDLYSISQQSLHIGTAGLSQRPLQPQLSYQRRLPYHSHHPPDHNLSPLANAVQGGPGVCQPAAKHRPATEHLGNLDLNCTSAPSHFLDPTAARHHAVAHAAALCLVEKWPAAELASYKRLKAALSIPVQTVPSQGGPVCMCVGAMPASPPPPACRSPLSRIVKQEYICLWASWLWML